MRTNSSSTSGRSTASVSSSQAHLTAAAQRGEFAVRFFSKECTTPGTACCSSAKMSLSALAREHDDRRAARAEIDKQPTDRQATPASLREISNNPPRSHVLTIRLARGVQTLRVAQCGVCYRGEDRASHQTGNRAYDSETWRLDPLPCDLRADQTRYQCTRAPPITSRLSQEPTACWARLLR